MSNEPSRPADDDVPAGAAGDPAARPDVPPADADRIAASRDAAASAEERELSTPASSGLGTGAGSAEPAGATPEPGAGARERPVAGNEPVTPAGPTAVPGARPAPAADPVEPASAAPAVNETGTSGGSGRKVLIGVLVVLLIGIVVYGVRYLTSDPANAEAGDCVSVSAETDNRAEVDTLDCSADQASYKVGKVLDATDATCPEDGLYTEIVPAGGVGDGYKLCLLPNMAEGSCYKPDEGTGFVKTQCTGPETIKVTKVIEGSTDLEACADGAGMAYPEPPVTYCLAPAEL
ncbi:hypothetical protein IOD16_39095 [Saccharothrix sp. 6-C]|uniref:LppU/SCO3897 family protein n=1 Tax=Saccharothrix sp. 6-C TaxID=2781735 RepID=UPI001916E3D1|nr:hypothetical protein [Saccharothrix sp. 6-C]QQQ76890.1 hypothetical protein IOD16_39095 [Saccharothrix sp. 6-C]